MYRAGLELSYYRTWYPGKVKSHLEEPGSYLIENNYNKEVKRTEQHMRPFDHHPIRFHIEYVQEPFFIEDPRRPLHHSKRIVP